MNQSSKNALVWVAIFIFLIFSSKYLETKGKEEKVIKYSEFREYVLTNRVQELKIGSDEIKGKIIEGSQGGTFNFKTKQVPDDNSLVPLLVEKKIKFEGNLRGEDPWYVWVLVNILLPLLFFVGIWFFMIKGVAGGGKAFSFGRSRAKLNEDPNNKVTFADVAGIDEVKHELETIVMFLKDPKKFSKLGGRIPKGVLLAGGPGTGKTLLARAIAGEASVPFFSISGSDFVELFVGVGAARVRDMFAQAKRSSPCIIFIDEIDAVGRRRGAGYGGGHDEREQTLNQLLVEMDGFTSNEGIILIAATNMPDVLDPALLRPGRFDRTIYVPLPDIKGRIEILKVHVQKLPAMSEDVSLETIARGTPGFSGAELENLVNEAALTASIAEDEQVRRKHFEIARDKIMMGSERRSLALSEEEKRTTAYHEAGHALIAKKVPNADPIHKATIVPRSVALGLVQQLPEGDKYTHSKDYLLDRICVAYGGRVAEEIIFNQITTGASSDIEQITNIVTKMVCEWGMSDRAGLIKYTKSDTGPFYGKEFSGTRSYSEETSAIIDEEIREIVDHQYNRAKEILTAEIQALHALAEALLREETLDGDRINEILAQGVYVPREQEGKLVN